MPATFLGVIWLVFGLPSFVAGFVIGAVAMRCRPVWFRRWTKTFPMPKGPQVQNGSGVAAMMEGANPPKNRGTG
jgi:hypothetical protein